MVKYACLFDHESSKALKKIISLFRFKRQSVITISIIIIMLERVVINHATKVTKIRIMIEQV